VSRSDRQRLDDIQTALDAIDDRLTRGGLSDGLVYDAIRVRLIEISEAVKGPDPEQFGHLGHRRPLRLMIITDLDDHPNRAFLQLRRIPPRRTASRHDSILPTERSLRTRRDGSGGRFTRAETAAVRNRIVTVPARLARSARRLHLHLPKRWPWQAHWQRLWTAVMTT
jgi:hypothetical protein